LKTANLKSKQPKILLVDDNEELRTTIKAVLRASKFQVSTAANIGEALHLIDTKPFDVLLTDLHMPETGDGFTVVSAMRHTNPNAVTLVFTGYPALQEAAEAILLQTDEVLLKPMVMPALITVIREQLVKREARKPTHTERVASILERDVAAAIQDWLDRVELTCVPLSKEQRTGHLPKLLEELIHRLRVPRALGTKPVS
jgi:DNA-binding NtrC family response regulator